MSSSRKKKITVWLHADTEMAEIKIGRLSVHFGNYWDFHAGCSGPKLQIGPNEWFDFRAEWNDTIRRPIPVAKMIASKIGAEVVVKYRKTPFEI